MDSLPSIFAEMQLFRHSRRSSMCQGLRERVRGRLWGKNDIHYGEIPGVKSFGVEGLPGEG